MAKNILRLFIIIICTVSGFLIASHISALSKYPFARWYGLTIGFFFALIAIYLADVIKKLPLKVIIGATVGFSVGLIMAKLIGDFFEVLENPTLTILIYIILACVFGYVGLVMGGKKVEEFNMPSFASLWLKAAQKKAPGHEKILDTSVIIDGRISDIAETGFLEGMLVVPAFVMGELRRIAGSDDHLRSARGKRGLDVLNALQKDPSVSIQLDKTDYPAETDVDQKLLSLAKERDAKLVTNDINLTKMAQAGGVEVLDINRLASALKPVVVPGETLDIYIVKRGREEDQGVAFLEDGTMVVVANGKGHVGKDVTVTVTQVLQTQTGRLIFSTLSEK